MMLVGGMIDARESHARGNNAWFLAKISECYFCPLCRAIGGALANLIAPRGLARKARPRIARVSFERGSHVQTRRLWLRRVQSADLDDDLAYRTAPREQLQRLDGALER
jgi:hypothetical protein